MKGRQILDGVLVHEAIHSTKKAGSPGAIQILDMNKAYDRVDWDLLWDALERFGFSHKWIS